jgi:hypothetical protein
MKCCVLLLLAATGILPLSAQEAEAGFELRSTLSGIGAFSNVLEAPPRNGSPFVAGVRAVFYPTWKINSRWAVTGAIQTYSRPYFLEQFSTQGYGVRADILQAHLSYTRFWNKNAVVIRAGQLSSAFGSFLLRYDDAANPLIGLPQAYGYYYKGVTTLGLVGAQIDLTLNKLDIRTQFTNSSPANRRGIFDSDQYGSWTAGGGYTIRQGLRIGGSFNRGPYLHRRHRFYFPGEAAPKSLPAVAYAADLQFGHGAWTVNAEWQRFFMPYRAIPDFVQHIGYAEVRRVLHPRWYVAVRPGYLRATAFPGDNTVEFTVGFRPNRYQLVKTGYTAFRNSRNAGGSDTFAVQLVTSLDPISLARD